MAKSESPNPSTRPPVTSSSSPQSSLPSKDTPHAESQSDDNSRDAEDDQQDGPRKRRKRGPPTESPEDCFSCVRLSAKCDRQRPYCNQCWDSSRVCEGYRIQPIWGAGVARRGKLQDQTLPDSVAQELAADKSKAEFAKYTRQASNNTSNASFPSGYPQVAEQLLSWSVESGNGAANGYANGRPSGPSGPPTASAANAPPNAPSNAPHTVPSNTTLAQSAPVGYSLYRPMPRPQHQLSPTHQGGQRPYYPPPPPPPRGPLVGKEAARMRYLIRYYSEVITPVIVIFDTPTNPYRTSIILTAESCLTLRHAIAALSMSCIRQRTNRGLSVGKTIASRVSSQAHCRLTEHSVMEFGQISADEQMQEENFHRMTAVRSVNALLADPVRHADDLMASLLVLSLLYTSDAGVGSFPVDFTSSKRLLALRAGRDRIKHDKSGWILRLFAWFDTMTATVNNREGTYLDRHTSEEEALILENLTGCDRALFMILTQLPRLNMFSQMKPVDPIVCKNQPVWPAPPVAPLLHFPPLSQPVSPDSDLVQSSTVHEIQRGTDPRTGFWREWHAIRQKLLAWRPPTPPPPSQTIYSPNNLSPHPSPTPFADMTSISEAFRYSALLYLERLAHPYTPPTQPNFQALVNASVHYISQVHSDISLHWPLFITGAECTDEQHRMAIRQRCEDIQKNTGLVNNLKHLEILERIWMNQDQDQDPEKVGTNPRAAALDRAMMGGEAFQWRRVFDSEMQEGVEYILT